MVGQVRPVRHRDARWDGLESTVRVYDDNMTFFEVINESVHVGEIDTAALIIAALQEVLFNT